MHAFRQLLPQNTNRPLAVDQARVRRGQHIQQRHGDLAQHLRAQLAGGFLQSGAEPHVLQERIGHAANADPEADDNGTNAIFLGRGDDMGASHD